MARQWRCKAVPLPLSPGQAGLGMIGIGTLFILTRRWKREAVSPEKELYLSFFFRQEGERNAIEEYVKKKEKKPTRVPQALASLLRED